MQAVDSENVERRLAAIRVVGKVGRELTDFFPARDVKIGDVRLSVNDLSSDSHISDISFDVNGQYIRLQPAEDLVCIVSEERIMSKEDRGRK